MNQVTISQTYQIVSEVTGGSAHPNCLSSPTESQATENLFKKPIQIMRQTPRTYLSEGAEWQGSQRGHPVAFHMSPTLSLENEVWKETNNDHKQVLLLKEKTPPPQEKTLSPREKQESGMRGNAWVQLMPTFRVMIRPPLSWIVQAVGKHLPQHSPWLFSSR